ncbi:MAG: tRNA threonylcarbamoyladenosine dehydratase [Eubacterium sp.]|nr:tRNA threonylcarbamoyladenosine dehydratase [Eubacterium sp.]
MLNQFARTELLIGKKGSRRLAEAHVAVFGIGGVGGYVVEALARSGIGTLDLIDHDKVSVTNLNRQIFALHSTIGKYKVDVARERILDINPNAQVNSYKVFYMPDTAGQFDFSAYDYIVDAIDTITGKIALAEQAQAAGTPIISSMGAGNKMDPSAFQAADLYETSVCPLAKAMRRELKKRGILKLKVVYSKEQPLQPLVTDRCEAGAQKKPVPGSNAFVPSAAGLVLAGEVVKDLLRECVDGLE